MFVYKMQVNPSHTIFKYGDCYDFGIGNGAVLKSSSQWQLNEFWKLNNSVHELFFNILLIAIELLRTALLPIHKVIIIAIF